MRAISLGVLVAVAACGWAAPVAIQPADKAAPKDTRAAEFTRDRYLKVKVTGEFKDVALREILKEFAAQVQMDKEFTHPVMWTYADAELGSKSLTYTCTDKPLDAALTELCTKLKLGFFVISQDEHARDGWVKITSGMERGFGTLVGTPKAEDEDETKAAARLAVAKEQIEKGRAATAKAVLNGIVEKFPKTKAAAEAKALLEKLDK